MYEAAGHPLTKIVAVCDVFQDRREKHAETLNQRYGTNLCTPYRDLREMLARKDIDAVTIATRTTGTCRPPCWPCGPARTSISRNLSGFSMEEDIAIRREVQRYGSVFQYGTQQRSMSHIRFGCKLVRNGRIGKIQAVEVTAPSYGFEGGRGARARARRTGL